MFSPRPGHPEIDRPAQDVEAGDDEGALQAQALEKHSTNVFLKVGKSVFFLKITWKKSFGAASTASMATIPPMEWPSRYRGTEGKRLLRLWRKKENVARS